MAARPDNTVHEYNVLAKPLGVARSMHPRYNSTSTVRLQESMAKPDSDGILVSVSKNLRGLILNAAQAQKRVDNNLRNRDPNREEVGKRRKVDGLQISNLPQHDDVEEIALRFRKMKSYDQRITKSEESEEEPEDEDNISEDEANENAHINRKHGNGNNNNEQPTSAVVDHYLSKFSKKSTTSTSNTNSSNDAIPTLREIFEYLKNIYTTAQCSVDCTIICEIYVRRFLNTSHLTLNSLNWRSILMTAMLLASKVWDDLSMVNADFSVFLPYSLAQINTWERQFLAGMKYNVRVSAAEYAERYFDAHEATARRRARREKKAKKSRLETLAKDMLSQGSSQAEVSRFIRELEKQSMEDEEASEYAVRPLDIDQARKLEILSSAMEARVLEMKMAKSKDGATVSKKSAPRRAVSDQFEPRPAPRFIIN